MEDIFFTHKLVLGYLAAHYLLSYRKGTQDHYYNYRNRKYIPVPVYKEKWSPEELFELFSHPACTHSLSIEFTRFINHIKNQ